jgi:hypothetical protein
MLKWHYFFSFFVCGTGKKFRLIHEKNEITECMHRGKREVQTSGRASDSVRERERVCAAPWISEPSYHTGEHSHSVLIFRPKHGKNDGPVALFIRIWAICALREKLVTKDLSSHRLVGSRLFLFSCPWWFSCVSQFCCAYIHDFCFVYYLTLSRLTFNPTHTHQDTHLRTQYIHQLHAL